MKTAYFSLETAHFSLETALFGIMPKLSILYDLNKYCLCDI